MRAPPLQDARLNYVEQHAEAAGIDASRLESARVAASRSSPMGDTLDVAARVADEATLPALVPVLCQLAQRGTGVNTRVGTARFIASLAARLGSTLRPHAPALTKACCPLPSALSPLPPAPCPLPPAQPNQSLPAVLPSLSMQYCKVPPSGVL